MLSGSEGWGSIVELRRSGSWFEKECIFERVEKTADSLSIASKLKSQIVHESPGACGLYPQANRGGGSSPENLEIT
jgi:hypothetical protein